MRTIIIQDQRQNAHCAVVALLVFACAQAAADHEYTVTVDDALSRLTVDARFDSIVTSVSARSNDASRFLLAAHDCDSGETFSARGRRLRLPRSGIRCLHYVINLKAAAQADRRNRILHENNIIVSPAVWMWRPRITGNAEILVHIQTGDGQGVSVPWDRTSDGSDVYRLSASPESGTAIAAFGQFETAVEQVAGATLRITFLNPEQAMDTERLIGWLRDTAENVALAYGRFPNPRANIVVIPAGGNRWGGDQAVSFGRVIRDGGETIELMIDDEQPLAEFYDNWTATHEFSHLMLPYLRREHRWISEGFAQYYQNVLLARADQYTQTVAWHKLHDGLERGRASAPELSPNGAAAVNGRNTRMKIYWSGASLALMADTELRRRSDGKESLDTVLDQFQQCCLPSARTWSGPELFRKFDSFLQQPLFMDLYRQYSDQAGFPDARRLLQQLGVVSVDGTVELQDDTELAWVRRTITNGPMGALPRAAEEH